MYVYTPAHTHCHSYHVASGRDGILSHLGKQLTMTYFVCENMHLLLWVSPPNPFRVIFTESSEDWNKLKALSCNEFSSVRIPHAFETTVPHRTARLTIGVIWHASLSFWTCPSHTPEPYIGGVEIRNMENGTTCNFTTAIITELRRPFLYFAKTNHNSP